MKEGTIELNFEEQSKESAMVSEGRREGCRWERDGMGLNSIGGGTNHQRLVC